MADITTYDAFSNEDLAEEIILLNKQRKNFLTQASSSDRSYTKDFTRIDRDFSNAMKSWAKRGGRGIPKDKTEQPGGGTNVPSVGVTDFSEIRIS